MGWRWPSGRTVRRQHLLSGDQLGHGGIDVALTEGDAALRPVHPAHLLVAWLNLCTRLELGQRFLRLGPPTCFSSGDCEQAKGLEFRVAAARVGECKLRLNQRGRRLALSKQREDLPVSRNRPR